MQSKPFDPDAAYDLHAKGIYRFCRRLVGSAQDAEDLVQETFLAAIAGSSGFEHRSSEATWLFRIARNKALKLMRRRKLERLFVPDRIVDSVDTSGFAESVAQLPERLRETFLLVKVEGFTCSEAAAILDIPEGTVKFRVHSAVMQLRTSWLDAKEPAREGVPHAV